MGRRQKILDISAERVKNWLENITDDTPEDLSVRGARYDPFRNTVEFLLESGEFPEVMEGEEPEVMG